MLHHREGQVVAACPSCHLKEVIMTIINLNRYYYPQCHRNALIEVPDEVAEILERGQRAEHNQESKKTYHKVYSLDQSPALENHAAHFALSPEEVLLRDLPVRAKSENSKRTRSCSTCCRKTASLPWSSYTKRLPP